MQTIDRLKHFGYAIVEGVIPAPVCAVLAGALDELEAARRTDGTLFTRGMQVVLHCIHEDRLVFRYFIDDPAIYRVAREVLNSGEQIIMNSLSASRSVRVDDETWEANADASRAHIDHRMPTPDFEHTASVCAMICLDDFTENNGALKIWPLSHLARERPPQNQNLLPPPTHCLAPKGSVIYWLGQTWHAIGRNTSGTRRWALINHYTYWWIKPTFNYVKNAAPANLTQRQRVLLGYNSIPPSGAERRTHTVTEAA